MNNESNSSATPVADEIAAAIVSDETDTIETWRCETCNDEHPATVDGHEVNGNIICESCYDETCWTCEDCHCSFDGNEESYERCNCTLCESCTDNYSICDRCDDTFHQDNLTYLNNDPIEDHMENYAISYEDAMDYTEHNLCEGCLSQLQERCRENANNMNPDMQAYRKYCEERNNYRINGRSVTTIELKSTDVGDVVKSSRLWSCEVEHYTTNAHQKVCEAYDRMPKGFGLCNDGSLSTCEGTQISGATVRKGIEIQSCLLGGLAGENAIASVLSDLSAHTGSDLSLPTCVVDSTCGLHIHIDTRDILDDTEALCKLWGLYMVFEPVIMSFLPANRRTNRYCKPFGDAYSLEKISKVQNRKQLEALWYDLTDANEIAKQRAERYQSTRYYGVNLHSIWRARNLEIRHHSGTLNVQKVLEWANLHTRIVDWCADHSRTFKEVEKLQSDLVNANADIKERTQKLFDLLDLPKSSRTYLRKRQRKFFDQVTNPKDEESLQLPIKKHVPENWYADFVAEERKRIAEEQARQREDQERIFNVRERIQYEYVSSTPRIIPGQVCRVDVPRFEDLAVTNITDES